MGEERSYLLLAGGHHLPSQYQKCLRREPFLSTAALKAEDITFLREAIINDSSEALKSFHERLVRILMLPHVAKQRLEASGRSVSRAMKEVDRMIVELNENLHTSIEEKFRPYLSSMIAGDLSFLRDASKAAVFYWGLAAQYARTNHLKRLQRIFDPKRAALYRRLANALVHIIAANVGSTLFAERDRHSVVLLQNTSAIPFITADQPLINIASNPKDDLGVPTKFELYYPLSPTRAMLLLEPGSIYLPSSSSISQIDAQMHNLRLASHAQRQVLAAAPAILEAIRDELPAYLSCFS